MEWIINIIKNILIMLHRTCHYQKHKTRSVQCNNKALDRNFGLTSNKEIIPCGIHWPVRSTFLQPQDIWHLSHRQLKCLIQVRPMQLPVMNNPDFKHNKFQFKPYKPKDMQSNSDTWQGPNTNNIVLNP